MNASRSLFDNLPDDFPPATDRSEPVLWIRRLVILRTRTPDAEPVRNLEFRRGLNIVATAQPEERVDGIVGHNVGKTLLTRLIRYCLGEQNYARELAREKIIRAIPDGCVIAEVVIDGIGYVVLRPLSSSRPADSACIVSDDWYAILHEDAKTQRFSTFMEALEVATVQRFSGTQLPHQNRDVRWLDLLAWLSRDQYCRYRHPLQWRTAWTESGTADLHDEDASVLVRLVMNLLDEDESRLIQHHKQLLTAQNEQRTKVREIEQQLARTRQFLLERLQLSDELLTDDLFGDAARKRAEMIHEEIQNAIDKLNRESGLDTLTEEVTAAQRAVTRKEQEIETRQADRQTTEGELKKHQSASEDSFVDSLADLLINCRFPPAECGAVRSASGPGKRDPIRELLAQQKAADLQRLDQQIAGLSEELSDLQAKHQDACSRQKHLQQSIGKQQHDLDVKLARAATVIEEVTEYQQSELAHQKAAKALAGLESQVEQSRGAHHAAHDQLAARQRHLERHFNRVLNRLMASNARGHIEIDMRGLHIILDGQETSPGEAMASETALSLDLACLSASICGLGSMPRFLIHDSPREADLEPHIYARLFEFIVELENAFGDRLPSFQYIITTTTPPPNHLAQKPFLLETLDARETETLFLRTRF